MEQKNNIIIYPLIAKIDEDIEFNKESDPNFDEEKEGEIIVNNVTKLSIHYTEQLRKHFTNLGLKENVLLLRDLEFIRQCIDSLMYRSLGHHHELQDYIDEVMEE